MSRCYYTKSSSYTGQGEATNRNGKFIKGKFKIEIFSNGYKEISFDSNATGDAQQVILVPVTSRSEFSFKGRNTNQEFRAKLHIISIGKNTKFVVNNLIRLKGKFQRGEKQFQYFIDNINLGRMRYNTKFIIDKTEYHLLPYNYGRLDTLQKFGGKQTTGVITCKSRSQRFASDKTVLTLLSLLSFYNANYISLSKIVILQDHVTKEIYYDDKTYPYNHGNGVLDFTFIPISNTIESTFPNFRKQVDNIHGFSDLIEIYIESLNAAVLETKCALVCILFEGLKARYVKSKLVDEYHKVDGKMKKKSFRQLLREIFNSEKFKFSEAELQSLVILRNLVIHEATATSVRTGITFRKTIRTYIGSVRLFEKFMLRILKYKGTYWKKTHNKGFVPRTIK